jgi:hypothetical protein
VQGEYGLPMKPQASNSRVLSYITLLDGFGHPAQRLIGLKVAKEIQELHGVPRTLTALPMTDFSTSEAILTMKKSPIAARNDGSLQIQVHDTESGGRMFWSRQYYVVPLEVLHTGPIPE